MHRFFCKIRLRQGLWCEGNRSGEEIPVKIERIEVRSVSSGSLAPTILTVASRMEE